MTTFENITKMCQKAQKKTATVTAASSTHMEVQITREKKTKQQC
jgi:hypothetical protein